MMKLILGTRGSPLALAQSRMIAGELERLYPDLSVEERVIRTTGDVRSQAPLPVIGGKGVFTLEIEAALLNGDIHFAVHSLKDLPPEMPSGLSLAAVPAREDASDCCIMREPISSEEPTLRFLGHGARVGTSSLRRRAMLLNLRPDLRISDVRGNVDTRLKKLHNGEYDALILASAGLNRLELQPEFAYHLPENSFMPAPGQGALAIQAREADTHTLQLLQALDDFNTHSQIVAERALVRSLNAGCSTPLGARALTQNGLLLMFACVLSPDGARRIETEVSGSQEDAEFLGEECAEQLRELGADELLN